MSARTDKGFNPIWLILFVALALRTALPLYAVFWNQDSSVFYEVYSSQYLEPAQNLVKFGKFIAGDTPEIYRTPGYPAFLTLGILLQHVVLVTIALQILLSCLTVLLVFKIALLIFDSRQAAAMCAALYAVEPLSIIFSSYLLPETCFTFALSLCLYYFVSYIQNGWLRDLTFSALVLAAAIYIHPLAYFLPPVLGVLLMVWAIRNRLPAVIVPAIIFLVICASLIAPWQVRNYVRTGYHGFSTLFDNSLYYAQGASLLANWHGKINFQEVWPEMARKGGRI